MGRQQMQLEWGIARSPVEQDGGRVREDLSRQPRRQVPQVACPGPLGMEPRGPLLDELPRVGLAAVSMTGKGEVNHVR